MKKILILVSETNKVFFNSLFSSARKEKVNLDIKLYEDIQISFKKEIDFYIDDKKINDYDLVYIWSVRKNQKALSWVTYYCKTNHMGLISLLDTFLLKTEFWQSGKSYDYLKLAQMGLPIIHSYTVFEKHLDSFSKKNQYPCIAKIGGTSQGKGVFLCKNKKELKKVFSKTKEPLLIQSFIENDGDLRIVVVGNRVIGAIKRTRTKDNEFRNNVSLGGKAEVYEFSKEQAQIAIKAAKILGYSIAGVDLIFDSADKKWKILEVNRSPQFTGFMKATGVDMPREIIKFLKNKSENL